MAYVWVPTRIRTADERFCFVVRRDDDANTTTRNTAVVPAKIRSRSVVNLSTALSNRGQTKTRRAATSDYSKCPPNARGRNVFKCVSLRATDKHVRRPRKYGYHNITFSYTQHRLQYPKIGFSKRSVLSKQSNDRCIHTLRYDLREHAGLSTRLSANIRNNACISRGPCACHTMSCEFN